METGRIDTALVQRGLVRSRTQAARLIAEGKVRVEGRPVAKPSQLVGSADVITLTTDEGWASRGAHKLIGALDSLGLDPVGRRALDAGASTGGFTDVLLRRGAAAVAAVDVGSGQLAPQVAADPRVHVFDHTNIRSLTAADRDRIVEALGGSPDLIVADLSFISLTLVLPALVDLAGPDADLLPMVKPQFEVGKGRLGSGGVVRRAALRIEALEAVVTAARDLAWGVVDMTTSPLPGPSGNVEYFVHLRKDGSMEPEWASRLIRRQVEGGRQ